VGDYWRGLKSVDGGYTDSADFERYFSLDFAGRCEMVAMMMLAKSLAKYSVYGKAHFNQWGEEYGAEVPEYWNDLMALFSNEWIQHCYGYTGVIGAPRPFGPGFPDHETWDLMPELNARSKTILSITGFEPPYAEVAIVYPIPTFLTSWGPENYQMTKKVHQLLGLMPALGIQADAISVDLLAAGRLNDGVLQIREQKYRLVLWPYAKVIAPESLSLLEQMRREKFPIYFLNQIPTLTSRGDGIKIDFAKSFDLGSDINDTADNIEKLHLPSPTTKLPGAYISVIPNSMGEYFLLIMPVDPNKSVSGIVKCFGRDVKVAETDKLAIYKVGKDAGVIRIL